MTRDKVSRHPHALARRAVRSLVVLAVVLAGSVTMASSASAATESVTAFVTQWTGQFPDYDSAYGSQCVDLFDYYNRDVVGAPAQGFGNAYTVYGAASPSYYDKHPAGDGYTPVKGDVAVWNANSPGSGGAGHVGVVMSVVNSTTISILEANSSGTNDGPPDTASAVNKSPVITGNHSTSYLEGYLHPRALGGGGGVTSGNGTLWFIKSHNPGSGHVEIHSATPASGYQSGAHIVTWFSPADANNGWFQMVGSDLYFIKTKSTGSGRVEVHSAAASQNYQNGVHSASAFSTGDADNGWFQMAGGDLYFIKTKNTGSGRVELFRASASSGFSKVITATATAFSPADANNGWFQIQGGDLIFIKTKNTGSGRVEFFRASASSGFSQVVTAVATAFSPADANNGWFSAEDVNSDGNADLIFIKTHNPGSGHVEFFVADGSRSLQQVTSANVTWLSPADANNGWFLTDSKQ